MRMTMMSITASQRHGESTMPQMSSAQRLTVLVPSFLLLTSLLRQNQAVVSLEPSPLSKNGLIRTSHAASTLFHFLQLFLQNCTPVLGILMILQRKIRARHYENLGGK